MALNKIYRSRDGLAAVSSNTSIMSELSNISKSSLPSSMSATQGAAGSSNQANLNQMRQVSVSTSTAVKQLFQAPPPPTVLRQSSLAVPSNAGGGQQHKSTSTVAMIASRLQPQSMQAASRRASQPVIQADPRTSAFKKPGLPSSSVSHAVASVAAAALAKQAAASGDVAAALLTISTAPTTVTSTTAAGLASSPSSASTNSSSRMSTSKSNEAKLGREIKRLEALCESRTKELSMLKLKLKESLCSFDAIAVAYDYLANKLNGFEANGLRVKLEFERKKTGLFHL